MKFQGISKESRTVLSIFVSQLLDIINTNDTDSGKISEIREYIAVLTSANDLHPEEVYTLKSEQN